MEGIIPQISEPLEHLTLGRDSYSSASYSGISESHSSSTHSPHPDQDTELSSGYINDYSELDSLTPKGFSTENLNGIQDGRQCTSSPKDIALHHHRHLRHQSSTTLSDCSSSVYESLPVLPAFERNPWSEQEVLNVLREGRTKHLSGHITVEMMQYVCDILQRPLVRIANEARRLSMTLRRCGKHEVYSALHVVLSRSLAESCQQACAKAVALYAMSGESLKKSKSSRCGLKFSVGKFHRWMVDMKLAPHVHEYAAIFLAAAMENLLEEIVLRSLSDQNLGNGVLSVEILEFGIGRHSELWGLVQPYQHLIAGRSASGMLQLPACLSLAEKCKTRVMKNAEQSLLATSANSVNELGNLVTTGMHLWNQKSFTATPSSSSLGSGSPGHQRYYPLSWGMEALHTLRHYMARPSPLTTNKHNATNSSSSSCSSPAPSPCLPPPLVEWLRVATAHTEQRHGWVVDADDVRQAARLLLPGADCAPRKFGPDEALSTCRHLDAQKCAVKFQQDLAFRMLSCGRSDLITEAIALLPKHDVNTFNEQGLSPLMYACIQGDEAMVQILLDAGADVNATVPCDVMKYPCVHPETKKWTALTFSSLMGQLASVQLLIERGAWVEGYAQKTIVSKSSQNSLLIGASCSENEHYCETPLQLAAAIGHYELVCHLLEKGADPYLTTAMKNGVSFTYSRGGNNAFTLAAAHGHKQVLRKLLTSPVSSQSSDFLSLEEMLAEGHLDTTQNKYNKRRSKLEQDIYDDTKNQYMTIDDVLNSSGGVTMVTQLHDLSDSSGVSSEHDSTESERFTRAQYRVLQDTLYHASENGQVDIALELRDMGIPWTMHSWGRCLEASYVHRKKSALNSLLKDFYLCRQEEINVDFMYDTLPLMMEIFKNGRSDPCSLKLAAIFASLYGTEQIPPIPEMRFQPPAKIDPRFVNNPELSDVQFLIEGKTFYGHKIILVNASNRFRAMLSTQFTEVHQQAIPLTDVRYHIFEYMMQYLYHGGVRGLEVAGEDVLELLGAAHFFMLDGLQRHCEVLCSQTLNPSSCTGIYKHAKLYNALELLSYCEAYMLQNLTTLLNGTESVRKMIYSVKRQNYDLVGGLLTTLTHKIEERVETRTRKPVVVPNGLQHLNSIRI